MDWKGETNYAIYDNFKISDEKVTFNILPTVQNELFFVNCSKAESAIWFWFHGKVVDILS